VHYGEEPELVPSHTVYLTGCNLRCLFCHTADERRAASAAPLTAERLNALVRRGRREGAWNVNFLGGEPFVNLPALLRLFAAADELPALVWNSNFYCSAEALAMVSRLADVYLADLKFGNASCAGRLAGAPDYRDVVRARLRELYALAPEKILLRHLVLPGHVECCTRPALEWVAAELPGVRVSLKQDYLVMPAARSDPDLSRFLSDAEASLAERIARSLEVRFAATNAAPLVAVAPPPPCGDEPSGPGGDERGFDAELVIAPDGKVFLRHPTRELTALAACLAGPGPA